MWGRLLWLCRPAASRLRSQSGYPTPPRAGLQVSSQVKAAVRSKCQKGVLYRIAWDAIGQSAEERIVIPRRPRTMYGSAASRESRTVIGSPSEGQAQEPEANLLRFPPGPQALKDLLDDRPASRHD